MKDPKDVIILVVDDDPVLKLILVHEFKSKDFKVLAASSGNEAIRLVQQNKIDIILSDIQMPDGDGLELLDAIKKIAPKVPVLLFMSGFSNITPEEAIKRGAYAILPKPFERAVLQEIINNILRNELDKLNKTVP